jgi:pimeloyl-ACP methyl ester carboxylesterase
MIEQLQRWGVALVACALLGWALWCVQAGHPLAALAGPALVLGVHAGLLGIEFILMCRLSAAPPPAARVLRAWLGEIAAAITVFCWRQPFRSQAWPDHLPARPAATASSSASGGRGVLLLHGFMCNRGVWNRWLARLARQKVPVVALNLEPIFGPIEAYVEVIEAGVLALEQATGQAPVVVAHSMGGLALRRWWVEPGNEARLAHAITIGTPHHGTWLARFGMGLSARQMRLGSRWLGELAAVEPAARAARITCFRSPCDNIVFPCTSAGLAGAQDRLLDGPAHVQMIDRPEPWAALQAWLTDARASHDGLATAAAGNT